MADGTKPLSCGKLLGNNFGRRSRGGGIGQKNDPCDAGLILEEEDRLVVKMGSKLVVGDDFDRGRDLNTCQGMLRGGRRPAE